MGIFNEQTSSYHSGGNVQIVRRIPGIGFKLTKDNNYDMKNTEKNYNLDTQDDFKTGDAFDTMVKDLKSAVDKEYLNSKFLKKDKDGHFFDLKQKVIKNTEPYYDGLFQDNDLVSKKYVNQEKAKQDTTITEW